MAILGKRMLFLLSVRILLQGTLLTKYCSWNHFMTPTWRRSSEMKRQDESTIISAISCRRNNKFLVTILWLRLNAWWHGFLLLLFGNRIPPFNRRLDFRFAARCLKETIFDLHYRLWRLRWVWNKYYLSGDGSIWALILFVNKLLYGSFTSTLKTVCCVPFYILWRNLCKMYFRGVNPRGKSNSLNLLSEM